MKRHSFATFQATHKVYPVICDVVPKSNVAVFPLKDWYRTLLQCLATASINGNDTENEAKQKSQKGATPVKDKSEEMEDWE